MDEFIKESQKFITEKKVGNDYCIIVLIFLFLDFGSNKVINKDIKYIYKNLDEFKEKFKVDCLFIDSKYGVDFQLWIFD